MADRNSVRIYEVFQDSRGKFSSKRVFGAIGFLSAIALYSMGCGDGIDTLLYVSAAMLGLDAVVDAFRKNG